MLSLILSASLPSFDFGSDMERISGSPEQDTLIIDSEDDWPLFEPLALTFSPVSSEEDVSKTMPSTPRQSVLLPGFHFSTTDENVDPAEFHRIAAQLLSGEAPPKRDSGLANENARPDLQRQLHCDLGKDPSGRFCCSCGKSYTTSLRLREHVRRCAGTTNFPCMTCDKVFETKAKLDRHVAKRHNGNKEPCPECGEIIPAHQLPKHLASGLGGCDGMIQAAMGPAPEVGETIQLSSISSPSQQYWIYEGDLSWSQSAARDSKLEEDDEDESKGDDVVEQTMLFIKQLLRRPMSQQPVKKPCDICGELFDADGDELALHIGKHSLDFNEKRHKCHDCHIYFANERDLERHLQSASLNHHCGFAFRHNAGTCTGHHPPTYYKSSLTNDHDLMQRHLWAWELRQLRTHRLAIASVLAEQLSQSMNRNTSLQNARRTYNSLLPHFSIASVRSSTATATTSWRDSEGSTAVDDRLSNIISEILPAEDVDALKRISQNRPDSAVITPRKCGEISRKSGELSRRKTLLDAIKQDWKGHKRAHSGPVSLLKQQASKGGLAKHRSLPPSAVGSGTVIKLVA